MSWKSVILSLQETSGSLLSSDLKINAKNKINKIKSKPKSKTGTLDISDDKLPLDLLFKISKQLTKSIEDVEILLKEKDVSFNSNSLATDETINDLIPLEEKSTESKENEGKVENGGDESISGKEETMDVEASIDDSVDNSSSKSRAARSRANGSTSSRNGTSAGSESFATTTNTAATSTTQTSGKSLDKANTASTTTAGSDAEIEDTSKNGSTSSSAVSNSTPPEKLITIGAKYGYPAPPPLSTYNGKIGRSFYTSAYNPSTPILPNSQVAYCPSNGRDNNFSTMHSEWILCRVLRVISETRFEIQDPEPDDLHPQGQIFRANYKEIILVPLHLVSASKLKEYKTGTRVLAKYPETTTFYPAEVMASKNGTCMLRFEGEEEVGKLTSVDRVFVLPCPK